jgi:ribosomal protein L37AE/L43A
MGTDGKRHAVKVDKRPRPEACELCHRDRPRLHYHHWNDAQPEQGVWVCSHCHRHVEAYEKGLIVAYLKLKRSIVNG